MGCLKPRELVFVKKEMERVMTDETRWPTERTEAERIYKTAEEKLKQKTDK